MEFIGFLGQFSFTQEQSFVEHIGYMGVDVCATVHSIYIRYVVMVLRSSRS